MSTFATTPVGRAINTLSKGRIFQTADQRPGFQIPASLQAKIDGTEKSSENNGISNGVTAVPSRSESGEKSNAATPEANAQIEKKNETGGQRDVEAGLQGGDLLAKATSRVLPDGQDLNLHETVTRSRTLPTAEPSHDTIIVDWYGPDDPENPKNFTLGQKINVTMAICFLTFSVYAGSSIITPSIPGVMEHFDVSQVKGTLTLSVYIMGYGVGPLLLGPPSDIPSIGRSTPYWMSMLCLVLFNVGAAKAQTYGTLITMRLLGGIMGSPALATGGASLGDVWENLALPKAISIWAMGAVCGPVLGPVIAGWAAQNVSFRLPYWLFVAMSGIGLIVVLFMLPETLPANILYRRAKRLRKLTGNDRLKSQGEVDQAAMKPSLYIKHALWMPIRISVEPIVLYSSVLLGLIYAIFYAAFEAVPIIFGEIHHFNLGEQQLPYLGLGVNAFCITLPGYILYLVYYFDPRFVANIQKGIIRPEDRVLLAIFSGPLVIVSLFWLGWTSKASISYWSPLVALSLYLTPVFLLFQSVLVYLSFSYVEHQASVLAANDLIRSLIASSFPIFAGAMFRNLGLGPAYSMLAGISIVLLVPLLGLYVYGAKLRTWSSYAHNYECDLPAQEK